MKKNFFKGSVLALFAMFSTSVMGQTVSATDVTVAAGSTEASTLSFTAEGKDVIGFQFYVSGAEEVFGTDLTLASVEAVEDAYTVGADVGFNGKFNTKKKRYTVTIGDKENEPFIEGEFLKFNFAAADGLANGDYNVTINVCEMTYKDSEGKIKSEEPNQDIAVKVSVGGTGIEAIEVINNAPVYNLNGMLMNGNLQKGVYVQNGKKFIVK